MSGPIFEIDHPEELERALGSGVDLCGAVFQSLDLRPFASALTGRPLRGAAFLGCDMSSALLDHAHREGALIFPPFEGLPYNPYRNTLYDPEELYAGFVPGEPDTWTDSLDNRIYRRWRDSGGDTGADILETLARRIHDHAITDALHELIDGRRVVAVMGGHSLGRDSGDYATVARLGRSLARLDRLTATGGGPGAMEAAHLGAFLASRPDEALDEALAMLAVVPRFDSPGPWLDSAWRVRETFAPGPDDRAGLGIPTWLYGHEPPNVFASHIAKYFANSVREDGLLAIATYGVVFTPGSAGTVQEIFQDVTQNHYGVTGAPSPMVFLGRRFWTDELPVGRLLTAVGGDRDWLDLVHFTDDVDEAVAILADHTRPGDDP